MKKIEITSGYWRFKGEEEIHKGAEIYTYDSAEIEEATEEEYQAYLKKQEEEAKKIER